MKQQKKLQAGQLNRAFLIKSMLIGAGIALILISLFLFMAGEGNPEWPAFWRIKPLIIVPLAGATGGVCFYFLDRISYEGGWKKVLAYILSFIVYVFGLWIGTVLGLNGTMWN